MDGWLIYFATVDLMFTTRMVRASSKGWIWIPISNYFHLSQQVEVVRLFRRRVRYFNCVWMLIGACLIGWYFWPTLEYDVVGQPNKAKTEVVRSISWLFALWRTEWLQEWRHQRRLWVNHYVFLAPKIQFFGGPAKIWNRSEK